MAATYSPPTCAKKIRTPFLCQHLFTITLGKDLWHPRKKRKMQVTAQHSLFPRPQCSSTMSLSPLFVSSKTSLLPSPSLALLCSHSPSTRLYGLKIKARQWKKVSPVFAASESSTDRWLLEPIGDGDTRHIGFKVERPGAYEIASSAVTVGRLPDKADLVIPVATVSGLHARIQKKEGSLLVTDLDSTNGTFIDDKKLRPGVAAPVSPGSSITFGDIHLAMFRLSKLEGAEVTGESEDSPAKTEADNPTQG